MTAPNDRSIGRDFWERTPAIALGVAVVLLVAGVLVALYGDRSYKTQKMQEISVQAQILGSTVTAALTFMDRDAAREYVNALKANPEIQAAAVYDANGSLFASYSRAADLKPPETMHASAPHVDGNHLMVATPVMQDASSIGTVYLQTVTEPFSRRIERYGIIALLITMTSLVIGVLGVAHAALKRVNTELAHRASDLVAANENLKTQIEERGKVEDALRQAQKMEAIGKLTGGVAHDFNNLLQVVLGNVDTIFRRSSEPQIRKMAGVAAKAAERGGRLTRQLLAFARKQPLAPKPLEVNGLVSRMFDLLHSTLGETVKVDTILHDGAWEISADANQLESALLNLAVNARDAMPDGGSLTIETSNVELDQAYATAEEIQAGQYVMIAVTDNGTGMTADVLTKAFDPFFTTKEVGKGSGLGLSQVYGFMKQSGGHAKILSEPGQGTTVRLYFSRSVGVPVAPAMAPAVQSVSDKSKGELLLVVEDDDDVRAFTVGILRDLGYNIVEASDSEVALRLIDSEPDVRLLFTDIGLPGGLNGRQLADEARRRRPELRILYTSGYADDAFAHDSQWNPSRDLVSKPFNQSTLATEVLRALHSA